MVWAYNPNTGYTLLGLIVERVAECAAGCIAEAGIRALPTALLATESDSEKRDAGQSVKRGRTDKL